MLPKKPLALTTRKCSIFSTKHFSLAQFAQTRVSLFFSWHRLVKHASLGTDKLRPPAWRSGTDVKSPVAVEALSCELACTLRYVTIIFTFFESGTSVLFRRCPSDGGSESSWTSPWARMMAVSKALATSLVMPHTVVLSDLKMSKSEIIQRRISSLMKSELVLNLLMKLYGFHQQGRICSNH